MLRTIWLRVTFAADSPWIANQQRNANSFFVGQAPLLVEPMLAVEISVIARENDDGGVKHPFFLQRRENAAETVVNAQ